MTSGGIIVAVMTFLTEQFCRVSAGMASQGIWISVFGCGGK